MTNPDAGYPLPLTPAELLQRVISHDSDLIRKGLAPHQRPLAVSTLMAEELGQSWSIDALGSSPIVEAVHEIYRELYRPHDLFMPPLHIGAVMFRDVFFRVWVPVGYGTFVLSLFDHIDDMSESQKRWLGSAPVDGPRFIDQMIDIFDFGYGIDDYSKLYPNNLEAIGLLKLGRAHLEAAANACIGLVDAYAVVQNSVLACELVLKGSLRAAGVKEAALRQMGHNLLSLGTDFASRHPRADGALVCKVCASLPHLVAHRYERLDMSRLEIGEIVMKAQFLGGEVMRQLSSRDMRQNLKVGDQPYPPARHFPT